MRLFRGEGLQLLHHVRVLDPSKRRPPDEQVVERRAETVEVGANVDLMRVAALLRGHVVQRPHDLAGGGQLAELRPGFAADEGQTQIENLDNSLA